MDLRIRETPPVGKVTDAPQPIAVAVRVRWTIGNDYTVIPHAWAMAWTGGQVLVFWRNAATSTTAWLDKDQVRRRERPARQPGPS
jgi:hypothetical protein